MNLKKTINVGKVVGPYSPAIIASGTQSIFVSGQIASDLTADIQTQTIQVMNKIEDILEKGGAFLSDVVKTTIYLARIEDFKIVNDEYAKFFPSDPPARVTLQAAALPLNAGLMIDAIAIRS